MPIRNRAQACLWQQMIVLGHGHDHHSSQRRNGDNDGATQTMRNVKQFPDHDVFLDAVAL